MATHSSHSFASPDSPGDTQVVLVLLECSAEMLSYSTELQNYYLPTLLGALQGSNPDIPMRICWCTTADPVHQRPTFSSSASQIPNIRSEPPTPLSISSLRRALETLQVVYRDLGERATRHLIVVAANPPQDPANFHTQGGHAPEAATRDVVIKTLRQERIRLHMVLGTHPRFQVLRDFYRQILRSQISVEAPVWFQVDPRKFTFHLAAKPAALEGGGTGGPLQAHGAAAATPRSGPATPTSAAVSLPASSSSSQKAGTPRESAPATSPTRRSRAKGKETAAAAAPSMETQGPGLVNYLKQVHGLTKKRNYGAKASKRAAASEPTRASTSSRPILPRLELPAANLTTPARAEPSKSKPTNPVASESATTTNRYPPIAPALPPGGTRALTSDEARRLSNRRWPWLQPAPIVPPGDAHGLSAGANAALRSLKQIQPMVPPFSHPGEQSTGRSNSGFAGGPHGSSPSPVRTRPQHPRQATYPSYGAGSSPSPPHHVPAVSSSPPYHTGGHVEYHAAPVELSEASSLTYQSPIAHEMQHSPMYSGQPHYGGYPYTVSPQNSQTSSPLPSPAAAAAAGPGSMGHTGDDLENQPFLVSEEYEALANARFEEAVRSGAMQASMTPNVLSPVSASPIATSAGYFAAAPISDPMMAAAPLQHHQQQQQQAPTNIPQNEYTYAQQHLGHDVIHYQLAPGAVSDEQAHYYQPPSGADPSSHSQWYGS